jgi:hypothetical protein
LVERRNHQIPLDTSSNSAVLKQRIVYLKDGDKFLTENAVLAKKSEWRNLMAINVITLVMQFLTPEMIGRIAGALGLDRGASQTALGPGIGSAGRAEQRGCPTWWRTEAGRYHCYLIADVTQLLCYTNK